MERDLEEPVQGGVERLVSGLALLERLALYHLGSGNPDAAQPVARRALDLLPAEPPSVARAQVQAILAQALGLRKRTVAVRGTRGIGKKDMVHNDLQPKIEVDPETYQVRADGELLVCEPAKVLPMAQRYFLF